LMVYDRVYDFSQTSKWFSEIENSI
jgi:hypothetical protein